MGFLLSTDTACDISRDELKRRNIKYIPLVYTIDDIPHRDEFSLDIDFKAFYGLIREGKQPTTSQINILEHEEFFDALASRYDGEIVHLTLSSGLSSTYNSALKAAENVNAKYGRTKVYVVDSLGATVAHRQVVDEAERLRDAGVSAEQAASKLDEYKKHIVVWFMPTDLMHLRRGGRVSGASAVIGTALNIKPILIINKVGGLSVVQKKIGVGNGMDYMAEMFVKYSSPKTGRVYIPSADSEYAERMQNKIKALRPDCDVQIGWVGPVIGAHTGCNMVGVCFYSDIGRDA